MESCELQVTVDLRTLVHADRRALLQQAGKQEEFEEVKLGFIDAQGLERIDIQRAQLDIADAALLQRVDRLLHAQQHLLWPDGRVIFVLDLQDIGVELAPGAVGILQSDHLPQRCRCLDRTAQAVDVGRQGVVVGLDADTLLFLVLVADIAHAQRGGVGFVPGPPVELQHRHGLVAEEGFADCRRGAEEVGNHPSVALQVADHAHVGAVDEGTHLALPPLQFGEDGPEILVDRVVEMDPGNHLHHLAVSVSESDTVDVLHAAGVRGTVFRNRDIGLPCQHAGHRGRPENLVTDVVVDELVDITEHRERIARLRHRWRNELQHRLGVVGGDRGMRQCRAERPGMRTL